MLLLRLVRKEEKRIQEGFCSFAKLDALVCEGVGLRGANIALNNIITNVCVCLLFIYAAFFCSMLLKPSKVLEIVRNILVQLSIEAC